MPTKAPRASNLELLRILCMLLIIGDHLTGQGGIADYSTLPSSFVFCLIGCGSRIACTVFVLVGSWFMCEQPFKTRRPLSLWLSLWLYTVPVTLLCRLAGLDVSLSALRWAAFPAGTRQLWFISDYLVLLLCVPLLNRLLHGLPRRAHKGVLLVLAVPLVVYPTVFGQDGILGDTAWMFLYDYLLAAYLRRWPDNRLSRLLNRPAAALVLGLGLPLANTAIRPGIPARRDRQQGVPVHCLLPHGAGRTARPAGGAGAVPLLQKSGPRQQPVHQRAGGHDAGRLHPAPGPRAAGLFVERHLPRPGASRLGGVHAAGHRADFRGLRGHRHAAYQVYHAALAAQPCVYGFLRQRRRAGRRNRKTE